MMINNPLCDTDRLEALLCGQLSDADTSEVQQHLSHCEYCAQQIQLAAAPATPWNDAVEMLAADQYDGDASLSIAAALYPDVQTRKVDSNRSELLTREIQGWLDPTDDPHKLGRFAGYEIVGIVGHGGMGIVLKGFEPSLNRYVAIKTMAPRLASCGSARKRFAREAQAAAGVLHDNVIAIHRVDEFHGLPFLVMPYIAGESLQQRLDRDGPLGIQASLRIASQITTGLNAAHDRGLVHRDVKPANILLQPGIERVTITDFGLARAADDASMTRTGVIAGTPQYMSPEQASGDSIDARSDLFSLGSVLYAMVSGRAPFRSNQAQDVICRVRTESAVPLHKIDPSIPSWLTRLVEKLHAKSPSQRPASADEARKLIDGCLLHLQDQTSPLPTSLTSGVPKPTPFWQPVALIASVLILAALYVWTTQPQQPKTSDVSGPSIPIETMQQFRQEASEIESEIDELEQSIRDTGE